MDTTKLKRFAQYARRSLRKQIEAKLELVKDPNSIARREHPETVAKLDVEIDKKSKDQVIEQVAYTWFNRFCALRFMDVNEYNRIRVVSPLPGAFQPEILAEAKMGHIDEEMVDKETRQHIMSLLNDSAPSADPQGEAFRMLVVAVCNYLNKAMPFLFEKIADYTELLMPDDLLSGNSILAYTREAMVPGICEDVEVIGWLYQFYISEKKDDVFAGLKKNKKITPENIPAATQLFTPHWIVRYLVENSLGRLWMLNRPDSPLVERMEYYIKPEQPETEFLRINSPEEIKVCDPACGSGHMLTYAFDLLYAIYEEEGYEANDIPELILTHNLFGIEIDERAGELAAFALIMKVRAKQRRFFSKKVKPNICVLEKVEFEENELRSYMDFIGRDLFIIPLQTALLQFEEADNFGSLIIPEVSDVDSIKLILVEKDMQGNLLMYNTHAKVLKVLRMADYLSPKYHVVIANPPYMGSKGMNPKLATYAKDKFPDSKSDLFAMFIERNLALAQPTGSVAMITMQSWMFLSSFEKMRSRILNQDTILSMAHLGTRAFDSIGGEVVSTTAFVLGNSKKHEYKGHFLKLTEGKSEFEKEVLMREAIKRNNCEWFFRASTSGFKKIPGSPIAYWVTENEITIYSQNQLLKSVCSPRKGLDTGENDLFLRLWHETDLNKSCFDNSNRSKKWFPYNKGGTFRRWYGNREFLINWKNDGEDIKQRLNFDFKKPTIRNTNFYFSEGFTWTTVSSGGFSARYCPPGALFDNGGCTIFSDIAIDVIGGFINSKVMSRYLEYLSPTLNFQPGDVGRAPFPSKILDMSTPTNICVDISKLDWDSNENSWDFETLPLIYEQTGYGREDLAMLLEPDIDLCPEQTQYGWSLKTLYNDLRQHWQCMTGTMQRLEEDNNRIFIDAYGLQDELSAEVQLNEVSLSCNPHYRYGCNKTDEELEALLLADTMKEYISYAVGCMFGRYSLDMPGLVIANLGENLDDYKAKVEEWIEGPKETKHYHGLYRKFSFMPDEDNVVPILDDDWFEDDIVDRFRMFLKITFGEDNYEENLEFIENAIGKDIRKYFLKDFYTDHVKRYKKRPIYWLFSSPEGSFNALIYMHRYQPDTVSVVLNDYSREFRAKLEARLGHFKRIEVGADTSKSDKTNALKEIEKINKMIIEIEDFEHKILYPLATQRIEIDLDDGVKVNYPKFGKALKNVAGLS